jgi:hypothetical protein
VEAIYHQQVLSRAIRRRVSSRALDCILAANLGQDSLRGLLHPEYHFDNLIRPSLDYMEACRWQAARAALAAEAWAAFGRLSHAAQDFYSHSNYALLWLQRFPAHRPRTRPPSTGSIRMCSSTLQPVEKLDFPP